MRTIIFTLLTMLIQAFGFSAIKINHGPYLQELTNTGVTFVFNTSLPSFSYVEIKNEETGKVRIYYQSEYGLKAANKNFFSIRVEGLQPNTEYKYRIHSKEMKSLKPYKVVFGDNITSQWYTFSTINPKQRGGNIFITSDMHSNPAKLKKLLELCDYKTCSSFYYAGDMMNYMEHNGESPFTSFIDASVDMFATSKPFVVVRGNHETRGDLAREYPLFFPKTSKKIYGANLIGDVMIIMLDCGEDKSESHSVYAGLTDFNDYRSKQTEWLKELIKSKEYKKAKYKIVISHFPLIMDNKHKKEKMWYGWEDAINKFMPVLSKSDIDLVVSGHTHRFLYHESSKDNKFPILEQGASSATRLELKDGEIHIKVISESGETLFNKVI